MHQDGDKSMRRFVILEPVAFLTEFKDALIPVYAVFAVSGTGLLVLLIASLSMRTKRFYIIRHGKTLLNEQHIKQGADGSLSELGRTQAAGVGKALVGAGIKKIFCSTYPRAQETAAIINESLHVPIRYSPLLVERRNPHEVIGKPTKDPEVVRIVDQMDLAYHEDDYRFSDEENFLDLKKRARKALSMLARRGGTANCVVTHHAFVKMLVAYALYREDLHAGDFIKLSYFNTSDNAGITICEYHPWKSFGPTRGWQIISYNETLGDA